jgi:aryl-alcohol dehydrogenase-like predicted oxidoreductase
MRLRALGETGISVSEIGFGCGGTSGVMGRGTREQRLAVVASATDAGINFFDTAPGYDATRSETNLGETLQDLGLRPIIGTKVTFTPEDLGDVSSAAARSVEESLARLQVDVIDLLQLHNKVTMQRRPEFPSEMTAEEVLRPGGVADAFDELRRQGTIRGFGFTGIGHLSAVEQIIDSGRFQTVEVVYNLLNPSAGASVPAGFRGADYSGIIERSGAQGMGVIAIRVLAAGALSGNSAPHSLSGGWSVRAAHEVNGDRERAKALEFMVPEDQTPAQAALRFALMHPRVSTALVGFSDPAQVDELVACSDGSGLTQDAVDLLKETLHAD